MKSRRHPIGGWSVIAMVATLSTLAACGSDDGGDGSVEVDTTTLASTSTTADVLPDGATGDVQPDKVLLAAVLLAAGDVDTALSEGLVTAEEVDLAAESLDAGTLNDWMDRAEAAD